MSAADDAVGPAERLHPLFLLSGLTGSLRAYSGGYALIAYLAVQGRWGAVAIAALLLLAIIAVGLFLYWTHFEFRVGDSEIRIDKGVFSRVHRSIPFDRIQDVDIRQGPVARLLGLAKVKFETGGGSGQPGQEEGVLAAVTLERAEELRRLVRGRRGGAAAVAEVADGTVDAVAEPVFAMSLKRLLLSGTFNFSLALFAGLIGLTQTFGDFLGFDPLSRAFWMSMLSAGDPLREFILVHKVISGLAGATLLVIVGLVTGVFRTVLQDYGFRLDPTGVGLRRRRGLLTRTDVTLPVKRAQAAILSAGPVRDAFGWRELRLQSLARDEDKSGNHVLAPLATEEETARILGEFGWRPLLGSITWTRVSLAFVWTMIVGLTPLYLLIAAQAFLILFAFSRAEQALIAVQLTPLFVTFLVTVGLTLLSIATRLLAWRTTAYSVDGDRLLMRTGWWRRRTTILPLRRIQSIDVSESFISRWFGIASMRFGVAGGNALVAHSIPAIPRGEARNLRDRLLELPA